MTVGPNSTDNEYILGECQMGKRQAQFDEGTTLSSLKQQVELFVAEREWKQFHSPKNLAMAIGVEAGELMDLFRWRTEADSKRSMNQRNFRQAAVDELADVVICALSFANRAGIDISKAVKRKIGKNAQKYPVKKYKGRF
jgi:dCTP diphosphatase